jgi:hypothetical protein
MKAENREQERLLPARLVYIGTRDEPCLKLVESKDIKNEACYATLSYSWGDAVTLKTTKHNYSEFLNQIPTGSLPKTYIEAIEVAKTVNITYIWIDALCIIQDLRSDWEKQAAMMWQVYKFSDLTISATDSRNAEGGLFREREPSFVGECKVLVGEHNYNIPKGHYQCYVEATWSRNFETSELFERAWVCQERLLSPRIIHFAKNEVYWECHHLRASESFPLGFPSRVDVNTQRYVLEDSRHDKDPRKFLEIWESIVESYTRGKLTIPADKLTAVSALAREVAKYHDCGTYLAGLWEKRLIDQLAWTSSANAQRSVEYRAPSWSWACMDGKIMPNFNWDDQPAEKKNSREVSQIIEVNCTMAYDTYGSANAGILRIRGPLFRGTLEKEDKDETSTSSQKAHQSKDRPSAGTIDMIRKVTQAGADFSGDGFVMTESFDPRGDGSDLFRMGVDAKNGILLVDGSAPSQIDRPLREREYYMRFNAYHNGRVALDEFHDPEVDSSVPIYFLPLLFISHFNRTYPTEENFEIDYIKGLILTPTQKKHGQLRRMGRAIIEGNNSCGAFICEMGNQEEHELEFEEVGERLQVKDITPPNWPLRELDFIPTELNTYVISIV